jgi:uncharacterized protein YjbI with pentapeptide repeats
MVEAMLICQINKKYSYIQCQNPTWALDPEGLCILHSREKDKDPEAFDRFVKEKLDMKEYDFSGVFFPGSFSFSKRKFEKQASFSFAEFAGIVDFSEAEFGLVRFQSVKFGMRVIFDSTKFNDISYFYMAKFAKMAFFYNTIFTHANFELSNFNGKAIFEDAHFLDKANFEDARFLEGANFESVEFENEVKFNESIFNGEVSFNGAIFSKDADFSEAKFAERVNFSWNKFSGNVFFHKAKISGRMIFQSINKLGGEEADFLGDFRNIEILPNGEFHFNDLSLKKVQFAGTDLRPMKFFKIKWPMCHRRIVVYDEICKASNVNLEELYRHLKLNYERDGNLKQSGEFHYGEMEMHRKASPWRRWFSWYSIYWALSGYGERPLLALGWLAVFLVGMAALVWGLRLEVGNPPYLAGFGDSFIYLLQKVTLQRPTWAEPVGFGGKLIAGLSVLLIPGQAALFLLALRNRLGRRR